MKEKDLSSLNIRTDLVTDIIPNLTDTSVIDETIYEEGKVKVSNIVLDSKSSKIIGKKEGNYTTIFFDDITDTSNFELVKNIFIKEFPAEKRSPIEDTLFIISSYIFDNSAVSKIVFTFQFVFYILV